MIEDIKNKFLSDHFGVSFPMRSDVYYLENGDTVFMDNYNCTHYFKINQRDGKKTESCNLSVELRDYVINSLIDQGEIKVLTNYCKRALEYAKLDMEITENMHSDNPIDIQAIADHREELRGQIDYMTSLANEDRAKEIGE